jgi:uncharacterized protein (DUF39 family)
MKIAREIASELKTLIKQGEFFLTEPVELLPRHDKRLNKLDIRGD